MNDQSTIQIYYGFMNCGMSFTVTFSSSHYQQEGADVTFIRLLGTNIWLKVVNLKNWKYKKIQMIYTGSSSVRFLGCSIYSVRLVWFVFNNKKDHEMATGPSCWSCLGFFSWCFLFLNERSCSQDYQRFVCSESVSWFWVERVNRIVLLM